ncbi:O-antigen ligase family protein [Candidatus Saccharibacteria bacterium]|nr:O-antigen ligase family protein [Candidatus Saccharibacteria bacterium]
MIIVLLPFHAFLTVWLASAIDHYTLLRLWKEFLLIIISAGVIYLLVKDSRLRRQILSSRLAQLIAVYFLISLVWGIAAYAFDKTTIKALGFGLIVNLRFLIFFLAIWIIATPHQKLDAPQSDYRLLRSGFGAGQAKSWLMDHWQAMLLVPAAVVIVIGLLQWLVLPFDVLKHFGYSSETIFPYQTINRDINYPRIMSTLRGANPLGAYLVLILSGLAVFFLKYKKSRRLWSLFGIAGLGALFFSFSRGAWIGLALSGLLLAWVSIKNFRLKKLFFGSLVVLLVIGAASALALRNNSTFQNYFFHTNDRSTINESSNEEHISAFRSGLDDVANEPQGQGIGTAGPASVYNNDKVRIADNYFIQIGQEVGWLGLVVFLAINFLVARELWVRRDDNLALILLVSLLGLTAVNLVSHAWTDDTLAYIWWGLAGVAIATPAATGKKKQATTKNT